MNLRHGLRRITHILAVICAVVGFFVGGEIAQSLGSNLTGILVTAILGAPISYFLTWLIFYLVEWVVLGFHDSQDKDVRGKSKEAT